MQKVGSYGIKTTIEVTRDATHSSGLWRFQLFSITCQVQQML